MPRTLSSTSTRTLIATFALTSTLLGCNNTARPPFRIEVVNAQGQSPILGAASGRLSVSVSQIGEMTRTSSTDLAGGTFQLDLPVGNYTSLTRIDATLVRDGLTMYGSTAEFPPLQYPFIRLLMVPAGTCERVATQSLVVPRAGHAMTSLTHLTMGIGGARGDGTPTQSIEGWWTPQLTDIDGNDTSRTLDQAIARPRAVTLTDTRILVVGPTASILDVSSSVTPTDFDMPLTGLHAGAGELSALVSRGLNAGAVLIGGDASANVSWVAVDRSVQTSPLPEPRTSPVGMRLSTPDEILAVGGNTEGNPLGAVIPTALGVRMNVRSFGPTNARHGGWLAPSADRRSALYIGSRDGTGTLTPETFLITGCPAECSVTPGPMWNDARENATFVDGPDGTTWILGGLEGTASLATVERIVWDGATPRIAPAGALNTPRESAAAVHLAGGMILISGGRNGATMLSDFELCAPASR